MIDSAWEKAGKGICPICNSKSLVRFENYAVCTKCGGAPMECCGSYLTLVVDAHPHEVQACPRCGETNMGGINGHMFFIGCPTKAFNH